MFENLSDKLTNTLRKVRGQAKISEVNLEEALKEIRLSLLEADVNFKVVKSFLDQVKAKALGAIQGFNYTDPEWTKQAQKEVGGFDIVIDSAGGPQFSQLFDLMMPGGRIAIFGRTAGNIPDVPTRLLYWKQISIHGTTMGTRDEFLSMLDLLESRNLKPVIDQVYPLENIHDAFQRMKSANQFGKIVLKIK